MSEIILLVEDNPSDEKLTLRALGKAGVNRPVVVARDGVEALEYLFGTGAHVGRDPTDPPAIVLLDLELPRVDGHEVLQRMRADERTRLVPVIMLTSSALEKDALRCYAAGANAYVLKPVDFSEFVEAARIIERFWLQLNEPPPRPRSS